MTNRWIHGYDPEDESFWLTSGRRIARRNLICSVLSEHIGFSVWSLWSVLVIFDPAGLDLTADEKFLLVVVPTLVGALLRLPYSYAVTRFGGRDWTVAATVVLLVPTLLAAWLVQRPGTALWVLLLAAAVAGVGGGNFASSMTNVAALYPRHLQGRALGINAGAGNLGVAVAQIVGLLVIFVVGVAHPEYVPLLFVPVILIAAFAAARWMDNIDSVRAEPGALRAAARHRHTWWISLLYIGTFGSFVGYSFAFGLVLQHEFGATALEAASYTFLGPLVGSLARPLGGMAADRWGGAWVTLASFAGMAAGTGVLLLAAARHSFALFVLGFIALFVLSGVGNGSTYKMIPAVFADQAGAAIAAGHAAAPAFAHARRLTGAVIGIAGAVGALGGVAINLAFRSAYGGGGGGAPAFWAFLGAYAVCGVTTWAVYLRGRGDREPGEDRRSAAPAAADRAPHSLSEGRPSGV